MRLFIAIPLPPDVAAHSVGLLPQSLPGLRRVPAENLHVTLAFLGWTDDGRLPDVVRAAHEAAAGASRFELVLERAGRFPERGRPRVVWIGLADGLPSVLHLGEEVSRALRDRGLRFDERPLSPHVTLARVAADASLAEARTVGAAVERLVVPPMTIDVQEIVVFQSELSARGPRYTPLAAARLGSGRA